MIRSQIQISVAQQLKEKLNMLLTAALYFLIMPGCFDDHFVMSQTIVALLNSAVMKIQLPLEAEGGKFVGHTAHQPSGCVWQRTLQAHRRDFFSGETLMALAKRAVDAFEVGGDIIAINREISRP